MMSCPRPSTGSRPTATMPPPSAASWTVWASVAAASTTPSAASAACSCAPCTSPSTATTALSGDPGPVAGAGPGDHRRVPGCGRQRLLHRQRRHRSGTERRALEQALQASAHNITHAAQALGISAPPSTGSWSTTNCGDTVIAVQLELFDLGEHGVAPGTRAPPRPRSRCSRGRWAPSDYSFIYPSPSAARRCPARCSAAAPACPGTRW